MARKCSLIYSKPLKRVVGLYIKPSSLLIMDWLFLVALRYNHLSKWKKQLGGKAEYRLADLAQTRRLNNIHGSFCCMNTVGTYPAAGYRPIYHLHLEHRDWDWLQFFSKFINNDLGWTVFTPLFFPEIFWIRTWLGRMILEGGIKTNNRERLSKPHCNSCIRIFGWQRQYQVTWISKKN